MVFITGLFLLLLLLEISLRLVGSVYAYLAEPEFVQKSKSDTTILSIGDSVTFGLGAEREFSYPAQLEKLLNESSDQKNYRVINRGVPGQNTTKLLQNLERQLKQIQPDIVTVLIGAQNLINYFGYRDYLRNSGEQHWDWKRSLIDRLDQLRIYKFARLLINNFNQAVQWVGTPEPKPATTGNLEILVGDSTKDIHPSKAAPAGDCATAKQLDREGQYDQVLKLVHSLVQSNHADSECYYLAGRIYQQRQQYDKAIHWYKSGVASDSGDFRNYDGLGQTLMEQHKFKEAMPWWKQGFQNGRSSTFRPNSYVAIAEAFRTTYNVDGAIEFFKEEVKRRRFTDERLYNQARENLQVLQSRSIDQQIYRWIESDIRRIVDLCKRYNSRVVLQGYPYQPEIEFIYKKVATDMNLPLVEHLPVFHPFVKENKYNPEYFVPDGHPNSIGYGMMAENILKVLQKKVMN